MFQIHSFQNSFKNLLKLFNLFITKMTLTLPSLNKTEFISLSPKGMKKQTNECHTANIFHFKNSKAESGLFLRIDLLFY